MLSSIIAKCINQEVKETKKNESQNLTNKQWRRRKNTRNELIYSCLIWFIYCVVFTETDSYVRRKYCERKKLSLRTKKWMVYIEKIYFFFAQIWNVIYSNVVIFYSPNIFLYIFSARIFDGVSHWCDSWKEIERVNFF